MSEIKNFADPHASSGHLFQHDPVPRVYGSENDLIDSLFVDNIPLDGLRAFEDLSYDRTVAGIVE
ncbi:hypothetical protein [Desulfopila aestuarii]|uniref:hypothetical protein n=1 Tax=Desulfopila aestuarii TaxID=231440 RepID=UPI000A044652|nr:hypothetical protein [Desulfopila aestuarii]